MKKMFISVVILLSFLSSNSFAQKAKEESILELMKLTESDKVGKMIVSNMMIQIKQIDNSLPEEFFQELEKDMDVNELMIKIVPIYQKYLSEEDIQKTIEFYKSSAGKNMTKNQTKIVNESMKMGEEWGREIAQKVVAKMRARQLVLQEVEPNK